MFDLVGNVNEWVTDWADKNALACTDWTSQTGIAGDDGSCFGGNGGGPSTEIPGALFRGGFWGGGPSAGVFSVAAFDDPSAPFGIGFRCAR